MKKRKKKVKLCKAPNGKIYKVVEDASFTLYINDDADVEKAECKNPAKCVVAQAFRRAIGKPIDFLEVGSTITKVAVDGVMYRVATPSLLRTALQHFDDHGTWHIKPGFYTLTPVTPSCRLDGRPNRWDTRDSYAHKNDRSKIRRSRAVPTRRVSQLTVVAKVA